jgi:hypothetical protein
MTPARAAVEKNTKNAAEKAYKVPPFPPKKKY